MARKKQEVALQLEIETQEEWEELLTKEGLIGRELKVFCMAKFPIALYYMHFDVGRTYLLGAMINSIVLTNDSPEIFFASTLKKLSLCT